MTSSSLLSYNNTAAAKQAIQTTALTPNNPSRASNQPCVAIAVQYETFEAVSRGQNEQTAKEPVTAHPVQPRGVRSPSQLSVDHCQLDSSG